MQELMQIESSHALDGTPGPDHGITDREVEPGDQEKSNSIFPPI